MQQTPTHTFELSGLGRAPFSIVDKSSGNSAFWCEHCGTTLKHRYFVKSSDGKVSVVGVDCLRKSGDQGLIDGAKRMQREKRNQARIDKMNQDTEVRLAKERKRYSGKTHSEVTQALRDKIERKQLAAEEMVEAHPLHDVFSQSNFGESVLEQLSKAQKISANVERILIEIHAKHLSKSRKNSKAYKAALPKAESEVKAFLNSIAKIESAIENLKEKLRRHITEY